MSGQCQVCGWSVRVDAGKCVEHPDFQQVVTPGLAQGRCVGSGRPPVRLARLNSWAVTI